MTAATKKAASKRPVAKGAKQPTSKPNEKFVAPEARLEEKKEPVLREMHQRFVDALRGGSKAYGTVSKSGEPGGWLVVPKTGNGKPIRVSHRLCASLVREISRKDRQVEYELAQP